MISQELINSALSWNEFYSLSQQLAEEKRTTGPDQSESLINYTELNWVRMQRIEKTLVLQEDIAEKVKQITQSYILLVITEAWCGDGAQNLPAIAKMCELNPNLTLKVIFRDEHLEIMDQFLTNGARSIPIVLLLDATTLEVKGKWGPKPQAAMQLLHDFKNNPDMPRNEFYKQLHTWYAKNKSVDIQHEIITLLS